MRCKSRNTCTNYLPGLVDFLNTVGVERYALSHDVDAVGKLLLTFPTRCSACGAVAHKHIDGVVSTVSESNGHFCIESTNAHMTRVADIIFGSMKHDASKRRECVQFVTGLSIVPPAWVVHMHHLCDDQSVLYKHATEMTRFFHLSTGNFADGIHTIFDRGMVLEFQHFMSDELRCITKRSSTDTSMHPLSRYLDKLDYVRTCTEFVVSVEECRHFLVVFHLMMPYIRCASNSAAEYNKFVHTPVCSISKRLVNNSARAPTHENRPTCLNKLRVYSAMQQIYVDVVVDSLGIRMSFSRIWFYVFVTNYVRYIVCNEIDPSAFGSIWTHVFR